MPRLSRRSYAWLFLVLIAALYLRASNITQPSSGGGSVLGFDITDAPKGGLIGGYDSASGTNGPPFGTRSPTATLYSWPSAGLVYGTGFCQSVASGTNGITGLELQKSTPNGTHGEHEDLSYTVTPPNTVAGCYSNTMTSYPILQQEYPEVDFGVNSTTGSARKRGWSTMLLWNVNQPAGSFVAAAVGTGNTNFTSMGAQSVATLTETDVIIPIPYDMTVRKICATITTAQPATGSLVLTARDSGVNTAVVLTIPASGAIDTHCGTPSLTHALVANDYFTISMLNNAAANSATFGTISWEFVPATAGRALVYFPRFNNVLVASTTEYVGAFTTGATSAVELENQSGMPYGGTMQNFKCYVVTAPATNNTVMTVFKNGLATSITLTVTPGGGTGVKSGTGTATFITPASLGVATADSFSLEFVPGAGAVAEISGCSAEYVWATT